nr:30S ribosomal protein S13 [Ishige okamurae]
MVRLLGRDLPNNKRIQYALTRIYGIGLSRSREILNKAGLKDLSIQNKMTKDLSDEEISTLRRVLEKDYRLEGELLRLNDLNIKHLKDNGCIRGRRHRAGLPVRGQRTRTNARTRKGTKKTVAGKKK